MTKEQEEAIEILENEKNNLYMLYTTGWQSCTKEQAKAKRKAIETILNMLKEKDKIINILIDKLNQNYRRIFESDEIKEMIYIYNTMENKTNLSGIELRKECIKQYFESMVKDNDN